MFYVTLMTQKPLKNQPKMRKITVRAICMAFALAMAGTAIAQPVDWRSQILYFVMTDRFADGDPSNNSQGADEFDPTDSRKWSGGDLRGIESKLDYVQGLGATALWITPPVRNQWWNTQGPYGGYHGYWATDFRSVDPHYGNVSDYKSLASALHGRGMKLVQDIVVNHTANFTERDTTGNWVRFKDTEGRDRPRQSPFDRNLSRDIYHFEDTIADFTDTTKLWNGQLAGLDDLNTENAAVRRALRDSYAYWMREVGVDAFRVDTAFYVPPDYFRDFLWSRDRNVPGILRVAKSLGKPDFLLFGEGFAIDKPFETSQDARIGEYMGRGLLPSMINFTYYGTSLDVFARGGPTAAFTHRLRSQAERFAQPSLMPTFIDNHDVERFLSQSNEASLRQALLAMFTVPGIPVIYYGTEQGFTAQRASMFATGYGSKGRDHFDETSPLYRYIAALSAFRKSHRALTHGAFEPVLDDAAGPGLLAWRMRLDAAPDVLVVINTADTPRLIADVDPLVAGSSWVPALDTPSDAQVASGQVMAGKSSWIFTERSSVAHHVTSDAEPMTIVAPNTDTQWSGTVALSGTGPATHVVMDSVVNKAIPVVRDGHHWRVNVDTSSMTDASLVHRLIAWNRETLQTSPSLQFRAANPWQRLSTAADPVGDDAGPFARYTYPSGTAWEGVRTADIQALHVSRAGNRLRVEIDMREISTAWNPANGFDHVSLQLYLDVPGVDGLRTAASMEQRTDLPQGMQWNRALRVHGWSNGLYQVGDKGSVTGLSESAKVSVDKRKARITLEFSPESLGSPQSLNGLRLWLNTWDFDGRLRPLTSTATSGSFGGGQSDTDPLWMDSLGPIEISEPTQ